MEMTKQEWDEATEYIASVIAAEVASEYGLWLFEPADAHKVWAAVTRFARRENHNAKKALAAQNADDTPTK